MNVPVLDRLPSFGVGRRNGNGRTRLNKNQRESFKETQRLWLDLALRIINSSQSSATKVLGVTSAIQGEGKTTNCIGIGSAISKETDEKILILECDLIRPALASHLDLNSEPGVVDFLQHDVDVEGLIQHTPLTNLDIVVSGGTEAHEDDLDVLEQPLLSALRRKLPNLLAPLRQEYKFIMLDMPPLLNSPYTSNLVKHTDETFLVVKSGATPSDSLERASDLIGEDKLSGVIFIGADSPLPNWLIHILEG